MSFGCFLTMGKVQAVELTGERRLGQSAKERVGGKLGGERI